ncbi:MAG: hypothetical protein ABI578_09655 [Chloroflexota bacterium]
MTSMNGQLTQAERNLGLVWVLATVVGWAVGFVVCEALKSFVSTLFVDGLVIGAFVGIAQGFAVRRLAPMGRWVLVSIIGFGIGLALGEAVAPGASTLGAHALIGAIIGTAAGVAQWLILRRHVARAGWWVPANIVAWTVGWTIIRLAEGLESSPTLVVYLVGAAGAAIAGIITAAALVWLARPARPLSSPA